MPTEPSSEMFRLRAGAEAARYGSDPWVFVRELLQNARDAGARRVEIEVSQHGGHARVTCRDDGCGMSYEHARRYLFALYASSKEDSDAQAGKFGIGFWSVLRFEPSMITIRSCRGGSSPSDAWQISLDGDLDAFEAASDSLDAGTEIVLERPVRDGEDLAAEVMTGTRHYGRFLTRRDQPETSLSIEVNGRSANAELELPAPSATFRGKGFRGAVGLGSEPEVELFGQGLFVRSASSLQDLRAAGELSEEATTENVLAELPSLAPRVLIDSAELDLMLARSDARHDKHLRRILRVAEKQLGRLITRQLQALKPQPFYRLWWGALRDRLEPHLGWHMAAAGLVGLVLGLVVLWWLPIDWLETPDWLKRDSHGATTASGRPDAVRSEDNPRVAAERVPTRREAGNSRLINPSLPDLSATGAEWRAGSLAAVTTAPGTTATPGKAAGAVSGQGFHSYSDLAERYSGPRPGGLAGERSRLALLYEPVDASPFFAALIIDQLNGSRWSSSPGPGELRPYEGVACGSNCVATRLLVAAGPSAVRLPVPTGHRLDAESIRLDGSPQTVFENANGEALLPLADGFRGVVEYRTGAAFPSSRPVSIPAPVDAPPELVSVAGKLRHLPVEERIQQALDFVAKRVVYDRSPAAGDAYRLTGGGRGFVATALEIGAGDCDVQSGVLVTLLRLSGIEARLALGYVGIRGTVAPGLHAWVEVRGEDGGWSVADPSVTSTDAAGLRPPGGGLTENLPRGGPTEHPSRGGATEHSPDTQVLPTAPAGVRFPSRAGLNLPLYPAVPLLAAALLLAGVAWALRRRSSTGIELGAGAGHPVEGQAERLAALLGGALRHPEAFAGLSAVFHGRFVPLLGRRGGISLARAQRMGRKNRLFRSSTGSQLARRAASRGVSVVDASTAEGRVLSLALGAIDVDHWSNLLERSSRSELSRRINHRLEESGAAWQLREASGLSQPWVEIALEDLGLGKRQILVDPSHLEYAPVRALLEDHPEAAAFTMLDVLLHRIELPESQRARILAAFARCAVEEGAVADGAVEDGVPATKGER